MLRKVTQADVDAVMAGANDQASIVLVTARLCRERAVEAVQDADNLEDLKEALLYLLRYAVN